MKGFVRFFALFSVIITTLTAPASFGDDGCAEYECAPPKPEEMIVKDGCKGYFEYPAYGGSDLHEFVVWEKAPGEATNSGCLSGSLVGGTEEVEIANTTLTADQLRYVNGENVLAYGEYRVEGEGEGTKYIFTKLILYVLPRPKK